jgi:hypothetical protein
MSLGSAVRQLNMLFYPGDYIRYVANGFTQCRIDAIGDEYTLGFRRYPNLTAAIHRFVGIDGGNALPRYYETPRAFYGKFILCIPARRR